MYVWPKPEPISKVIIHSIRKHGEPKLKKPKELQGIKQSFSTEWIYKKCICPCYVLGDDIYIKHRDYNSKSLYGLTIEEKRRLTGRELKNKFIWNDNFGCVVLRGEAWIILKDVIKDINNKDVAKDMNYDVFVMKIFQSLAKQITGDIGCFEMERFFERVISGYRREVKT